ncbi:MAG: hypothetical protein U5K00_16590 [Melioribacteraceae bacterium]|nr:hypothetical protein [Melioribacteraceae bacterium]
MTGFFSNTINSVDLKGQYHLIPNSTVSPFIEIGGGAIWGKLDDRTKPYADEEKMKHWSLSGGLGVEFLLTDFMGFSILGKNTYLFSDKIDGAEYGKINDYYWGLQLGITLYPNF